MTTKIKWQGAGTRLPDGHKIFETHDDGTGTSRWAIADESGATPDQTTDGILWLDLSRCLSIIPNSTGESISIPLMDADRKPTRTPTNAATILMLSRLFGWTIMDSPGEHFYNVR